MLCLLSQCMTMMIIIIIINNNNNNNAKDKQYAFQLTYYQCISRHYVKHLYFRPEALTSLCTLPERPSTRFEAVTTTMQSLNSACQLCCVEMLACLLYGHASVIIHPEKGQVCNNLCGHKSEQDVQGVHSLYKVYNSRHQGSPA